MESRFYTNYGELKFIDKLKRNIDMSKGFCFSVSFIKKPGLCLIAPNIEAAIARGAHGQLITSTYQNFTDIDSHKLFLALLVLGLCPTIYTTVRVFFLGQLPGDWSFSIAGQLSWINLLYEVISEAITLPLFFFIGKVKEDKKAFSNRVRTGMIVSLGVYTVLSAIVFIFAEQLLALMAADETIIDASAEYIRIEKRCQRRARGTSRVSRHSDLAGTESVRNGPEKAGTCCRIRPF